MGFKLENIFETAVDQLKKRWGKILLNSIIFGLITFIVDMLVVLVVVLAVVMAAYGIELGSGLITVLFGLLAIVIGFGAGFPLAFLTTATNYIIAEASFDDQASIYQVFRKTFTKSNVLTYITKMGLPLLGLTVAMVALILVTGVISIVLMSLVLVILIFVVILISFNLTAGILIPLYADQDIKSGRTTIFGMFTRKQVLYAYLIQFGLEFLIGLVTGIFGLIPILGFVLQLVLASLFGAVLTQAMIIHVRRATNGETSEVTAYKVIIKSEQLTVVIDGYGAQITSVTKDEKEYMWQADPQFWGRTSPVLFPFVGKLKDDMYQAGGETISMQQHGFLRDRMFKAVSQTSDSVTLEYTSTLADYNVYPVDFTVQISYQVIGGKVTTNYRVINNSGYEMPYQIGAHPGFNVENVDNLRVEFPTQTVTKHYFENGLQTEVSEIELNQVQLSYDLINKNIPCYSNFSHKQMTLFENEVEYMKFDFSSMQYLAIWSPEYKNAKFICIEPWNGICSRQDQVDYLLENKDGMNYLPANSSEVCSYSFEIC